MGIGLLQTHIYPTAREIPRAQRGLGVWGLAPIKCNRKASFHTPFSITAPSIRNQLQSKLYMFFFLAENCH
jgi:hypothetical protein